MVAAENFCGCVYYCAVGSLTEVPVPYASVVQQAEVAGGIWLQAGSGCYPSTRPYTPAVAVIVLVPKAWFTSLLCWLGSAYHITFVVHLSQ